MSLDQLRPYFNPQDFRISRDTFRNGYNWILIVLLFLNFLPILAPILLNAGIEFLAKPVYFLYSFFCHQFAHRSLHIHDSQCAWCTRDMGIWGAMLLVAIVVKLRKVTVGLRWYWVFPFVIPIALDGGIQTIATMVGIDGLGGPGTPLYISNNLMRAITGSIFGIGLGLFIFPNLYSAFHDHGLQLIGWSKRIGRRRMVRYTVFGLVVILVSYVSIIGLWDITSTVVEPANIVDLQVKSPVSKDFFLRRENGACPANVLGEDPLALECFWGVSP